MYTCLLNRQEYLGGPKEAVRVVLVSNPLCLLRYFEKNSHVQKMVVDLLLLIWICHIWDFFSSLPISVIRKGARDAVLTYAVLLKIVNCLRYKIINDYLGDFPESWWDRIIGSERCAHQPDFLPKSLEGIYFQKKILMGEVRSPFK